MNSNSEALESRLSSFQKRSTRMAEYFSHDLNWRQNSRTTARNSKNTPTTQQEIYTIWRISAELIIPLSPELAEKQANEEGNLTSIEVSIFVFKLEINNKLNTHWIRLSYDLNNYRDLDLHNSSVHTQPHSTNAKNWILYQYTSAVSSSLQQPR